MTAKQPALFISHGSPMLAIEDSETSRFLTGLGHSLSQPESKPKAILVFSAHLDSGNDVIITAGKQPDLIYDFYGFPQPLYELTYPAPGCPELAEKVASRLRAEGMHVQLDKLLGWDHGVWMPLYLMFPAADIPVVQVSVNSGMGAERNHTLGRLVASLREEGVLIIGSGGISHNLREMFTAHPDPNGRDKVDAFTDWISDKLQQGERSALLNYLNEAPFTLYNHPTQEHFLPLLSAIGTSDLKQVTRLHSAVEHKVLALDAYRFS
jgi:4,5-DOPA dioxygenase extradiol